MKFLVLAVACTILTTVCASPEYQAIGDEDILLTNQALVALVNKINTDLPSIIANKSLDPLATVLASEKMPVQNASWCRTETTYRLENLVGLGKIKVGELLITKGSQDDVSGLIEFVLRGSVDPVDLSIDVTGGVQAHCLVNPWISISGNVWIREFRVELLATAIIDNSNGLVVRNATVNGAIVTFGDVHVELKGLFGIFGPLVNLITFAIKGRVKNTLLDNVQKGVVGAMNAAIGGRLPFEVNLPGSS